jgi:REP element-mobilizing transposase RayT
LGSLRHCQNKKGLIIHAWNLMPSHLHLITGSKEKFLLHEIFRDFKKFTANEIIKCISDINESHREWILKQFIDEGAPLTRIAHYKVWQDGNHPIELATNKMREERLHYLHYNPVEAGLVWRAEDYCYSSAIDYAGGQGYLDVELIL